jgi:hypothetical protein
MSTNIELAAARADLHRAAAAADPHGRTQYALTARDNAASVLLEPTCTPLERDYAELYFVQADAIIEERDRLPGRALQWTASDWSCRREDRHASRVA